MHMIKHNQKKSPTSNKVENNIAEQILQEYLTFCSWVDLIKDDLIQFKEKQRNVSGINTRNAGCKGYDPYLMFKICLFQREFGLSDKKMFIRLHDSCQLKQCLDIESPDDIPSRETIANYRRLFARDNFMDHIFQKVTAIMQEQARLAVEEKDPIAAAEMNKFVMVDSTTVRHSVTRQLSKAELTMIQRGESTCEMLTGSSCRSARIETDAGWTFKNQEWHFGFKLHVGVDMITNMVLSCTFSTASVHDINELLEVVDRLPEKPCCVVADAGYIGKKHWQLLKDKGVDLITARKRQSVKQPLSLEDKRHNRLVSALRYGVEHVFSGHRNRPDLRVIGIQQAKFKAFLDVLRYNHKRLKSLLNDKVKIKRYSTRMLEANLKFG